MGKSWPIPLDGQYGRLVKRLDDSYRMNTKSQFAKFA